MQKDTDHFLKEADIAAWYRGTSPFQDRALVRLSNELRDDFEQGTCYRVDACLRQIGVDPIIARKKLNQIIQLSRGHDLAFLYFLLEGYYKESTYPDSEKPKSSYTSNEQLLMTAISKLDLVMTLRELDHILPLGHPSKKQELAVLRREELRMNRELTKRQVEKKPSEISPYFQKQPRPKVIKQKTSKIVEEDITVSFPYWLPGQDPKYVVPNENRWFATYQLKPVEQLINQMIDSMLKNLFSCIESNVEDFQISKISETREDLDTREYMSYNTQNLDSKQVRCFYHKVCDEQLQQSKDDLKVAARDRCLQTLKFAAQDYKLRSQRVVKQLNTDLNSYIEKYKNVQYSVVNMLKTEKCEACQLLVRTTLADPKGPLTINAERDISRACMLNPTNLKCLRGEVLEHTPSAKKKIEKRTKPCTKIKPTRRLKGGGSLRFDTIPQSESTVNEECKELTQLYFSTEKGKTNENKSRKDKKDLRLKDCRAQIDISYPSQLKVTGKNFFTAPTVSLPYKFEYEDIFSVGKSEMNIEVVIYNALCSALKEPIEKFEPDDKIEGDDQDVYEESPLCDSNVEKRDELYKNRTSSSKIKESTGVHNNKMKIIDLVAKCAKLIYAEKAKQRKSEMERGEEMAKELLYSREHNRLQYDIDYFDPDNAELMDRLLRDGFCVLRKDPRFVLAGMPDGHKLRQIREWIKRRYGKTYSRASGIQQLQKACVIVDKVMEVLSLSAPIVQTNVENAPVSYNQHDYMVKEGSKVIKKYHKSLNDTLMRQMTVCWFAIGSCVYPRGPTKEMFFSYMPSHYRDITRVHVWQSKDFKDMRKVRQFKKTNESTKI